MEQLVYLLEPNPVKCAQLKNLLKPLKINLQEHSSGQALLRDFAKAPATLILLALDISSAQWGNVTGLDLFLWFKKNHPYTTLILILDQNEPELERVVQWNGGYVFNYSEPRQLYHLLSRIRAYQNELRFAFNDITLFDLVQMVCLSQRQLHVYVNDTHSANEGLICFQQGRIQHAVCGNTTGENALFQLLAIQQGAFGEALGVSNEVYSITSDTSALLARSALQQDHYRETPVNLLLIDTPEAPVKALFERNYGDRIQLLTYTAEEAASQPIAHDYELILLHLDAYVHDPEALTAILTKVAHSKGLWVGSADALDRFNPLIKDAGFPFFLFPMQSQEMLAWFQHQLFDPCFEGELVNIQLFDVLQVLGLSNHSRQIDCYDAFLGECGELWLGNGQVLHATFGDKEGMAALECWMRLRVGHIFVQESPFPEKATIQQPINRLLMNMAVILDEASLIPETLVLSNQQVLTPNPGAIRL